MGRDEIDVIALIGVPLKKSYFISETGEPNFPEEWDVQTKGDENDIFDGMTIGRYRIICIGEDRIYVVLYTTRIGTYNPWTNLTGKAFQRANLEMKDQLKEFLCKGPVTQSEFDEIFGLHVEMDV